MRSVVPGTAGLCGEPRLITRICASVTQREVGKDCGLSTSWQATDMDRKLHHCDGGVTAELPGESTLPRFWQSEGSMRQVRAKNTGAFGDIPERKFFRKHDWKKPVDSSKILPTSPEASPEESCAGANLALREELPQHLLDLSRPRDLRMSSPHRLIASSPHRLVRSSHHRG